MNNLLKQIDKKLLKGRLWALRNRHYLKRKHDIDLSAVGDPKSALFEEERKRDRRSRDRSPERWGQKPPSSQRVSRSSPTDSKKRV